MKFSELDLHPALAAALAARGYETATDVQTAVLEPRNAGRDLLVSSQTGSGKTIAFGVAMVETLLGNRAPSDRSAKLETPGQSGGPDPAGTPAPTGTVDGSTVTATAAVLPSPPAPAFVPGGKRPAALVVVPTRELAVQVRDELSWLLAQTRLRLGSFTGGTAVSGDLRNLQRGVDVAIGTPGRLVDLLTRERLDLSGLRVVVLDEADEMLDLGFREDLETLLKAAAAERRTLLLSATLPAEIRSMARRYQRDALAIDPRKDSGASPSTPHADINYVAHLISGHDRLATVVNVLRASGAKRAIVFCTTRDAVSSLHAALVARGFTATAISGERAQTDRDRALGLIRSGQAQVLVATNVAARGLHLPDVDLIVHADLPLNAESLTHRSGRTGRAGRKGTAVVIATLTERRKAERLMAMAHVVAPWTPAPTPESITAAARERLIETLLVGSPGDEATEHAADDAEDATDGTTKHAPPVKDAGPNQRDGRPAMAMQAMPAMLDRLEAKLPARELLSRLLVRELERLPRGEAVHPVAMPDARDGRGRGFDDRERGGRDNLAGGAPVLFRVNMGAKDKADPKWILPLICKRGNVTRKEVGTIRVGPRETVFEISEIAAPAFARAAAETDPRAPQIRFERVPFSGRPERGPDRAADRADGARRPTARFAAPRGGRQASASATPPSAKMVPTPALADGMDLPPSPQAPGVVPAHAISIAAAPTAPPPPSHEPAPISSSATEAEPKDKEKKKQKTKAVNVSVQAIDDRKAAAVQQPAIPAPMEASPVAVPRAASLRSDASDDARRAKRVTAPSPVIEHKHTFPLRPRTNNAAQAVREPDDDARQSGPSASPTFRPPAHGRNAFPDARPGQRATPAAPAPFGGTRGSRPQPGSLAGSASARGYAPSPSTGGGFGPARRFVAHAVPGRRAAPREDAGADDRAGDRDSHDLAQPPRMGSERRPARTGFEAPSPRPKRPPFRPGGPRPEGFEAGRRASPPERAVRGGFKTPGFTAGGSGTQSARGFKSAGPDAKAGGFKSGGGANRGGGFKKSGGPTAGFGPGRTDRNGRPSDRAGSTRPPNGR